MCSERLPAKPAHDQNRPQSNSDVHFNQQIKYFTISHHMDDQDVPQDAGKDQQPE